MSTDHQNPPANEDINALADKARSLGLARQAPEPAAVTKPATPATPTDPFGRAASKPPEGFVEVPPPAGTRTEPGAPRTRHYRADGTGKMRTRADGLVSRRPDPAA